MELSAEQLKSLDDPAAVITEGRAAARPPGYSVVNFPIATIRKLIPH